MTTLCQAIESLILQESKNFELIVVAHCVNEIMLAQITDLLAKSKIRLGTETSLVECKAGDRGQPLNVGIDNAIGNYVVCLDDDDIALPNWISTYEKYAASSPNSVLRAQTGDFDADEQLPAQPWSITFPYRATFNFIEHLVGNSSPLMSLAFPLDKLNELNLRFDPDLPVLEDWDFLMRSTMHLKVISIPTITSLYRKWPIREKSSYMHSDEVWISTEQRIIEKLDSGFISLPPGSVRHIRSIFEGLNLAKVLLKS